MSKTTEIPCINLDCMDLSTLRATARTLRLLASYAEKKAEAMALRASGHIPKALRLEGECERIYWELPMEAKW